jgi:hypothetical protein
MLFQVYPPPVYGDLTGDGKPEAVLSYGCAGANYFGTRVWVFTGTASSLQLIGDLPDASANSAQGTVGSISKVTISSGVLTFTGEGYSPSAPHCCPDLVVTLVYRWTGTAFSLVSEQMTPAQ